jgi:RNA polymerase sigma-70 factor (sigma-E family)
VTSAREQAEAAYREFAAAQMHSLLRPAYYLTGSWHEAQDLVQASLVKMYLAWPRLRPDVDRHLYARKVMVNTYRAGLRPAWRRRETLSAAQPPDTYDRDGLTEERDYQRALLMSLPPGQRAVIVLRYLQDLSIQQTADCLGVSAGTVKSQTSDALAALRQAIATEGSER